MEDAELLRRYAETRSNEAFTELVRRHLPLVYSAALRRLGGDAHRAEDVAQCVFAALAQRAPRLLGHTALEGWLYTATRNVTVQAIRSEQRRAAREREAMMAGEHHAAASPVEASDLRPVIDGALDRLTVRDREIVLQRFFRERGFGEIGRQFGISENAARFRLNRALDRLRDALQKGGVTSTPAALALVLAERAQAATTDAMVRTIAGGALSQASAASAGATLANAIHFMSSTKVAAVVAVVIVGAGGFWAQRDYAALQSTRTELIAESGQYEKLTQQLAKARAAQKSVDIPTRATTSKPTATLAGLNSPGTVASPMAVAAKTANAAGKDPNDAVNWALSRDPAVRAALSAWMKSVFNTYTTFFNAAKLTPQQIDGWEDLMLQYNTNMGPNAVLTLRPEGKSIGQVSAEMHELLGDAAYQEFGRFNKIQFVEAVTKGLAGFVYDSDAPLTSSQAQQLTQVLYESSPISSTGGLPFPKDIDWNLALPRARSFLTPTQYDALKEVAVIVKYAPAGLNPALPSTYGDGANPPPALYALGKK